MPTSSREDFVNGLYTKPTRTNKLPTPTRVLMGESDLGPVCFTPHRIGSAHKNLEVTHHGCGS